MCNASLVEFLVLTDLNQTSGQTLEVGQDAVAIMVTFLQYASQNDQETQSAPPSLVSVLEQRLKENWAVSTIRDSTNEMMSKDGFGHSRSVRLFAQWQGNTTSFLAIAVQYSLTSYVVTQLEPARMAIRSHSILNDFVDMALDPLPTAQQTKGIPAPQIVATLLKLTKPKAQPIDTPVHLREVQVNLGDKSMKVSKALHRDKSERGNRKLEDAWADVIVLLIDHGLFSLEAVSPAFLRANFRARQVERLEDHILRKDYVFVDLNNQAE